MSEEITPERLLVYEAYSTFFNSEAGKIIFKDFVESYRGEPCFVSGDSHHMAFNSGRASVVFDIEFMLKELKRIRQPGFTPEPDNYLEEQS